MSVGQKRKKEIMYATALKYIQGRNSSQLCRPTRYYTKNVHNILSAFELFIKPNANEDIIKWSK